MWSSVFLAIAFILVAVVAFAFVSDAVDKKRRKKIIAQALEVTKAREESKPPTGGSSVAKPKREPMELVVTVKEDDTVSVNKPSARVSARDFTATERKAHEAYQRQSARPSSAPSRVSASTTNKRRDDDDLVSPWSPYNPANHITQVYDLTPSRGDDRHDLHSGHRTDCSRPNDSGSSYGSYDSGSSSNDSGSSDSGSSDSGSSSCD